MSEEAVAVEEGQVIEESQNPAGSGEQAQEPEKSEQAHPEEGKDEEGDGKRPRRDRTQRYIRQKTREAQAAKEEAAYWRGRFEASQGTQEEGPQRPMREDFEDYDDYVEALTDWKIEQRTSGGKEKQGEAEQQPSQSFEPPQQPKGYVEFTSKGHEAYGEDFAAALGDPELPVTQVMVDTILDSEHGPDLYMYLYDNPNEANRIANLTTVGQIRELDKLAEKVRDYAGSSQEQQAAPQRKASGAPTPPSYERGGGEGPANKDLADVKDIDEWMARRNATKKTL